MLPTAHRLVGYAALAACAYAALAVAVWFLADRLIFHPGPPSYEDSPDITHVTTADGVSLAVRFYRVPDATYTVLYSHGNAEDMGDMEPVYRLIAQLGCSVLAYDYRGYGLSKGTPTVDGTCLDIAAMWEYLTVELGVPADRIILWGRSVGGGPTLSLAEQHRPAAVILESAFTSAFRTVLPFPLFPFDRFPNLTRVAGVDVPVLVMHGRQDRIVPFSHGRALFERAPGRKQHAWLDKAGHNDLLWAEGTQYIDAVQTLIQSIGNPDG